MPTWRDLDAYAEGFAPERLLYIYPSLLLAVTFLVLLVCVDRFVAEEQRIWSRIGLALGIVYATMASINYNIQAVAVRESLREGETAGLTPLLPDNPHGVFTALANSYVYMVVAMVFLAPIFTSGRLETWIRRLLLAQGLSAIAQVGWSMFGLNEALFFAFSLVWIIGAPVVFVLLAIWFQRSGPSTQQRPIGQHGRAVVKPPPATA